MKKKRDQKLIFMTGGGTAGHVNPNLALAEPLQKAGYQVEYLGQKNEIEYQLAVAAGLPFHQVASGRLHRSLNPDTLRTPFRVIKGIVQAIRIIRKRRPALIFCKGGFASLPAAVAGRLTHTKVILHESDLTPGLANKLCAPFANRICTTFEETMKHLPEGKTVFTGTPIRSALANGSRERGFALTGLNPQGNPVLLVIGGSQGAGALNDVVHDHLQELLQSYQIVHLYGGEQSGFEVQEADGYFALAYAKDELPDLYAMTDVVLSRAGANSINELLLLKLPNILVPLPLTVSRGDQILNAEHFKEKGFSYVLPQEELTIESLQQALSYVQAHRAEYQAAMGGKAAKNGTAEVLRVILETVQS
ncbi:MAG: undecaprenyldiphospho-muramoylpentapeptide beta-N-acetylglucosaminyltransferase [Lachnospiraceae bacterium]|jgi:UDP-N-acetylglucosamine--N-acetylmuramyl-(pentapeptide) pyrophosphoryl-undecaprenol N-acetylglucosamine transferase|nr:undecaprenyldiphospho-muramoylpentapeptide beta-N-acetylglucosaminyltransferase [Lachnospiraceae bacterium]